MDLVVDNEAGLVAAFESSSLLVEAVVALPVAVVDVAGPAASVSVSTPPPTAAPAAATALIVLTRRVARLRTAIASRLSFVVMRTDCAPDLPSD